MANPGGLNEIGKVSVGVEANVQPLLDGLERAKQAATQAAQEIQQTTKINPLGYDTTPDKMGPTGAAASAYGYGTTPSQMAEVTRHTENQTRANRELGDTVRNTAGAVGLLVGEWERYTQIGQSFGDVFFQGTKQALELRDAINETNKALERSIQLREQAYASRVGGNRDTGSYASDKVSELDRIIAADQETLTSNSAYLKHIGQKLFTGIINVLSGGETGQMDAPTSYEQAERRIAENKARRDSLAREADAIRQREEARSTVGGVVGEMAGLSAGTLPPMGQVSPAEAEAMRRYFANNPDQLETIVYWNKLSYTAQQQQLIEMMNGNREVRYR